MGVATYQKLASLFVTNAAISATTMLRNALMEVMASANIPAVASNAQQGIVAKLGVNAGMTAVAPIWRGIELGRDPATEAASGKIQITASMFTNFRVIRSAAFTRTHLKLS